MANSCEGCPVNCCVDFKIRSEKFDPNGLEEKLQQFPFIKKVGTELVRGIGRREMVVGVYRCDEFDTQKGECLIYDAERPDFCVDTGKVIDTQDLRPHSECIL